MDYKRLILVGILCVSGCVTKSPTVTPLCTNGSKQLMSHDEPGGMRNFNSGEFPYFHWNAPIVQEVSVPAQILNGVFIPQHQELVLIKPGQWAKESAYPIAVQKEKYEEINDGCSNDSVDITCIP